MPAAKSRPRARRRGGAGGYSFHPLSRNMVRRRRSRTSRLTQGITRHHGGLINNLTKAAVIFRIIHGIVVLISKLLKPQHQNVSRAQKHHKKKPRIIRHRSHGIRRPGHPPKVKVSVKRTPRLSVSTGVFDVRTGKIKRMRVL